MKIRRFISIIILTIIIALGITFNSFAIDSVVKDENINNNIEDNLENNEDNTEGSNEDDNANDDTENDDFQNSDNSDKNNKDDDDIESDDNNNQENTENDDNNKSNSENNKPTKPNKPSKNDNNESNKNQDTNKPINNESEKEQTKVEENSTESETTDSDNTIAEESENADLRNLILDVEGLAPEFDKNITEYYLIVDLSIEEINIEAYPEDINSIVMIDGNTDLQEGENTISITVRAEAGNTKTYTINVTKTDDVDMVNANLKNLSVKGFNFYPSFKNNIYNYNLTINEKVSQLEITVEPEIEEATYKIIGNENLVEGDNLIKIIVTAKDGTAKREYKLNVYISSKSVELQEVNKIPAVVILSILGVAIIGTAIAISKKH